MLHRAHRTPVLPGLAIAFLLGFSPCWSVAGQEASAFEVRVTLVSSSSVTGVSCSSNVADALVCRRQPALVGQTGISEPVVLLYGKGLLDEETRMWGAVAASRRVNWGGRDYLEMTLTW